MSQSKRAKHNCWCGFSTDSIGEFNCHIHHLETETGKRDCFIKELKEGKKEGK
jgi:hypothetical protein